MKLKQAIGPLPTNNSSGTMDMMAMLNTDMMYFAIEVLACLFVSEDFRSGYAKNLFGVRSSKIDYVISKILVILCLVGGALFSIGLGALSNNILSRTSLV